MCAFVARNEMPLKAKEGNITAGIVRKSLVVTVVAAFDVNYSN